MMVAAFEHRLKHSRNIRYAAQVRIRICEYNDGRIGKVVTEINGENLTHWRLGDSYRVDSERGGPNVEGNLQRVTNGFDAGQGVNRSTLRVDGKSRVFGRIDSSQDPITEENRYLYWLDGKHTQFGQSLINYLVEQKGKHESTITANGLVVLTVPWQPRWSDK